MDSRDARLVLHEARDWARRGLLTPQALRTVEAEYGPSAAATPEERDAPGGGLAVLYALAGVLVGAACVAVPILLDADEDVVGLWLVGLGAPLLAAGLVLWMRGGPAGITDALLIGSLVPLTFMGAPSDELGPFLAPLSLLAAVAVTWLPRPSPTVPILGSVATFAASGILVYQWFGNSDFSLFDAAGDWAWFSLVALQLAATIVGGRMLAKPWRIPVSALLCVGLVVPFIFVLEEAFPSHNSHFYELAVGGFELALLGIGLALRERGLVLGGAVVVAGDAIVFAFDIDVLLGIVVLIGVAIALVALATMLKRRPRPAPRPAT